MKTAFGALLFAVLLLFAGGTPGQMNQAPTTPTTMVAGMAEIKRESAPCLRHREREPEAIVGLVDTGGGPVVTYTASSEERPVELKAHMSITDLGGTPAVIRSDKEGKMGRTSAEGTVGTVAGLFAVELKHSQIGAEHHDTKFAADQQETRKTQTPEVAALDPAYA